MVESNQKHFYLFEPVQLKNYNIIIPIFFYNQNGALLAKCYRPLLKCNSNHSTVEIHIATNPDQISYDSDALESLSVDEFSLTYGEIALKNGLKLIECCGDKIISKKFDASTLLSNVF
jgi:hypothetical protein